MNQFIKWFASLILANPAYFLFFQYFPKANPIYSSSGCKRVAQKTELFMSAEQEKERRRLGRLEDIENDEL